MKKKTIIFSFLFILFSVFFSPTNSLVLAVDPSITGLDKTAGKITAFDSQIGQTYDSTFLASRAGQLIGTLLAFVGVVFLILMIYGGLTWMLAGGNEKNVEKAKTLIINALIGLAIVLAAYSITNFVGNNLSF